VVRTWSNQSFPEGRADHTVTDITWYEAAAYAASGGKRLATIFQWEKAARNVYAPGTNTMRAGTPLAGKSRCSMRMGGGTMVRAPARATTPETVRSTGAYPFFSIESTYSPRAMRTLASGDIPSGRRDEAEAASPPVNGFRETVAPDGSVVTEIVSEIVDSTLVIVGSPGTYESTATARSNASTNRASGNGS
jgi:Sulfatase-modifying factor enzyme 1